MLSVIRVDYFGTQGWTPADVELLQRGLTTVNEARLSYFGTAISAHAFNLLPTIQVTTCSYCRSQRNELWDRCKTCGAPRD